MASLPVIEPPSLDIPTCCGSQEPPSPTTTRFHFALNVSNIDRSVEFYRKLFNVPPAKHHSDYAKFELTQPPLVFSLVPSTPGSQGALSHLGFPVASTDEVAAATARLAAAGLSVTCQDGTVCGYARQDKAWVSDPDNNFWEIYVVHEDVDPATVRSAWDGLAPRVERESTVQMAARVILEHRVTDSLPDYSSFTNGTIDEVRLTGTFNSALSDIERKRLLENSFRLLKPGGEIHVHGLVSSRSLKGATPDLPGLAALVKRIPLESEPLRELDLAGFAGLQITKLSESAVFQHGLTEMREIRITAFKPSGDAIASTPRVVVYKGPFSSITDDFGNTYRRGQRTEVTATQEELLSQSSAAKGFLFIEHDFSCDAGCS